MVDKSAGTFTHDQEEASTTGGDRAGPGTGTEGLLAETLAGVVHTEQVSVDSHFFDDLGADSLVMAHFCARLRKRPDAPSVSMKEIYRYPTVRSLAAALDEAAPPAASARAPSTADAAAGADMDATPSRVRRSAVGPPSGTPRYVLCATLQLMFFLAYSFGAALVLTKGVDWIAGASGLFDTYLRAVAFGAVAFAAVCLLPVVAKWALVGRWRPRQIRIWSLAYFRFWCVKTLIRSDPLVFFHGSPLYTLYLRALGARIGRRVTVLSRRVPVCTDLLTIGDDTVIRKDVFFSCYRAESGVIRTGPVTLGKDVLVGEVTVIDIDTAMGDGTQLGHASSLHAGQRVPDGEHWHGSPAQPTEVDYRAVGPARCGAARRAGYSVSQLLGAVLVYVPLAVAGTVLLFAAVPQFSSLLEPGPTALTTWAFYADALITSVALFFGAVVLGLLFTVTVPRVLNLAVRPDTVYPLFGFRYGMHRAIGFLTNRRFYKTLFGDSSAIVQYLSGLGYRFSDVEQTGSNFGTIMKQDNPFLSAVGRGTMVADGLSIINADFSSSSFCVSRATIGPHNFVGNYVAYPSQGRTGDNCLLATKVMVPVDGQVRENVGLLGSPSFEIPRSVLRDSRFDHLKDGETFRRRLAAKNKHNVFTMALHLFARWIFFFWVALVVSVAADLYAVLGVSVIALANVLTLAFTVADMVVSERIATGFRGLRPLYCSIYERPFWRHERYWKVTSVTEAIMVFNGTPFKSVIWRWLGVRIGRRVFDDGCYFPERSLVAIGDECVLNEGSRIQCHSQEDGTFKSDHSALEAGCTLGVGALVHYGVTMEEEAVLAPDSFLMKGEEMPRRAHWAGNPAREMPDELPAPPPHRDAGAAARTG
ncbi:Pls/PosA family non-ribosomal peptide synthetase [Streptomyces sp. NPDC026673]|uniref:Pls/PosA family non-ribosomal peptide synthetase n=1 Tax=Streptomyces sp. NPDC026673 TaxID=3155724 RepID=UPI0033FD8E7F